MEWFKGMYQLRESYSPNVLDIQKFVVFFKISFMKVKEVHLVIVPTK